MKVLLDECVPKRLANEFHNHDVSTVTKEGWSGTKNGDLLKLATRRFDVFVTVDQNLEYQQNLEANRIKQHWRVRAASRSTMSFQHLTGLRFKEG